MAWWKRKAVAVCELCGAKLPASSEIWPVKRVYVADGETEVVRFVCQACWQRHLSLAAEAEVIFRRENPVEDVCARLQHGNAEVRATAARQLARLGDRRTAADLRDALAREGWQFPVAGEIVKALAALGGPEAESALIAELHNDLAWYRPEIGDNYAQSRADRIVRALADMGGPTLVVRALCDTMTSANLKPSIRARAADYLSEIAYRFTVGYDLTPWGDGKLTRADRELMVEPLRAALRDESARVREYAASALGYLGDTRALQNLLDMLGDEDHRVRYFTAKALGNLGDRRAVPALRQAERDDPEISVAVREALARLR